MKPLISLFEHNPSLSEAPAPAVRMENDIARMDEIIGDEPQYFLEVLEHLRTQSAADAGRRNQRLMLLGGRQKLVD